MPNSDYKQCESAFVDFEKIYSYCLPTGEAGKAFIENIYRRMDDNFNFGAYLTDLEICW
jgi:hypothetical protein